MEEICISTTNHSPRGLEGNKRGWGGGAQQCCGSQEAEFWAHPPWPGPFCCSPSSLSVQVLPPSQGSHMLSPHRIDLGLKRTLSSDQHRLGIGSLG